jgi:prepilin-type N-terminal cleavage/methylation domain-containing protein
MKAQPGFSLLEVLLTLLLMSGIALGLLTQQWQMARLLNESLQNIHALVENDNISERRHHG